MNILIVEDNPADVFIIEKMLLSSSLNAQNIYSADRIAQAVTLLKSHRIDLVFLDLSLPDSFGIDSFLGIKPLVQHIPVVILTGLSESEVTMKTLQHGAQDYLVKGEFSMQLLVKSAEYSIERKKAEEKLIISERNYKQLFYKNPFPSWIYDRANLKILEVNDAAIEKYGYSRKEFMELSVDKVSQEEQLFSGRGIKNKNREHQKLSQKLYLHRKSNGEMMLMEVAFYQMNYSGRSAIQAQMNDVTEKVKLEEQLAEQRAIKQREITEAVLKAQEEERRGIGEELHDNINQILATSKLYLGSWLRDRKDICLVEKSQEYITTAMEEIRTLSKALISPNFILTDLKMSIVELVHSIELVREVEITAELEPLDDVILTEGLKLTIYRIVQEQLNNILKHANASAVKIQVSISEDTLRLCVSDNGNGFDTKKMREGIGLVNMNNRAALFNGHVEIESSPGHGCTLHVSLENKRDQAEQAA